VFSWLTALAGALSRPNRGRICLQLYQSHDLPGWAGNALRREKMRVLMLSWEYPPEIVGGIAPHVHDLALALGEKGPEVTVLARSNDPVDTTEQRKGLKVCRVARHAPEPPDFVSWVMQLNLQ